MMQQTITFSVVIPVYNAAATIIGTLQSVLDQRLAAYEIIIVNDCSTDDTEALLMRHFADRITYFALKENSGPSHARNTGINKATGSHIVFQDADDVWHPDKLKLMEMVLLQDPSIRFLFHDYTVRELPAVVTASELKLVRVSFAKLLVRNIIATPCTVINRADMLPFDESMSYTEDYDLFLRLAYKTGVYHVPVVLTRLNRPVLSAGGQSSNRWKMRQGELMAYFHLGRLHPSLYLLFPFMAGWAMLKHIRKVTGI